MNYQRFVCSITCKLMLAESSVKLDPRTTKNVLHLVLDLEATFQDKK